MPYNSKIFPAQFWFLLFQGFTNSNFWQGLIIKKKIKNLQKSLKGQNKMQRSSDYQSDLCVQLSTANNTVATKLFQSELICHNRKKKRSHHYKLYIFA